MDANKLITIKGKNYKVVVILDSVRCVIHDIEKRTIKILYSDNTKSQFCDVEEAKIGENTAWGNDSI